ncbi:fungal-specific transcription factor domain-domain-containing protein [Absidia repens]|uniref:Fungal-specific transcription factor domain-domain-containing protein n=1 Tax=Absidia repens TaxID=90262 RepID=A0A1X2J0X0_9FUNG|nr:fungal-specific transcription factor domain-domain-containing protein [Absidia repens]
MSSNTIQNEHSNPKTSFVSPSYQPQSHYFRPHEQAPKKRHLQPKPYPQLPPIAATDSQPFHSQLFEFPIENSREVKSQRNIRACDMCRRKKIRCIGTDLGRTCKSCWTNNIECTYNQSAKKRGPPKGYKEELNNRLKRLETLLNRSATNHATTTSSSPPTTDQPTPNLITKSTSSGDGTAMTTLASHDENQQHLRKTQTIDVSQAHHVEDGGALQFLSEKFNLEDERLTSTIKIRIRRSGKNLMLFDGEEDTKGRTPNQLLLEDTGILKPGEPILGMDDWLWRVSGIMKTTSDQLLKIYFTYIHPGLPVVNKTLFLNQYRGLASDYPSPPLLNAMHGAAMRHIEKCQILDDADSVLDTLYKDFGGRREMPEGGSEMLYDRLRKYIQGVYAPSITTVQAILIEQNHRASTESGISYDWLLCATAVRMAQDLGLHRSSETLDIPEDEKQTRCRVWWAVYIMDKWASASTGKPQTISDEDCDQDYPSESAPWEEVMDVASDGMGDDQQLRFPSLDQSIARNVKMGKIPMYQLFVQMAKLSEILGRILQDIYSPQAKKHGAMYGSDIRVADLDKALSNWRTALPPTLQLSGTNLQKLDSCRKSPLPSISVSLYLAYCTLLILLHRPFIVRQGKPTTNLSESSLSICISAATRCVDVASSLKFRDFILVSWNFAIYHVFTASVIHGHTALNSDSVVSDVAKTQLVKAIRVIQSISKFSTKASQIHQILLQLTRIADIPVDNTPSDDDHHGIPYDSTQGNEVTPSTPHNNIETDSCNSSDSTGVTEMIAGKSTSSSTSDAQTIPNSIQQHNDESVDSYSTPISLANENWINGLCSSFEQDDIQAPFLDTHSQLESDPNSLQQFGQGIEQMFTPIDKLSSSSQFANTFPTNQPQLLDYAAAGLPQNFIFGLSSTGFMVEQEQHQNTTRSKLLSDTSPFVPQPNEQPDDGVQPRSDDLRSGPVHSLVRNQPDNPFWSVPSSMEMDDWNTFLHTRFEEGNGS